MLAITYSCGNSQALQELKSTLKDQLSKTTRQPAAANVGGFENPLDTLEEEMSARKKSMDKQMGLEGSKEEEDAAKVLQSKFRLFKRKSSKTSENGTGDDSGESIGQEQVFIYYMLL